MPASYDPEIWALLLWTEDSDRPPGARFEIPPVVEAEMNRLQI
jgi:hypothetical protein